MMCKFVKTFFVCYNNTLTHLKYFFEIPIPGGYCKFGLQILSTMLKWDEISLKYNSFLFPFVFYFRSRQGFLRKFQSNTLRSLENVDVPGTIGRSISWTLVDEEKAEVKNNLLSCELFYYYLSSSNFLGRELFRIFLGLVLF